MSYIFESELYSENTLQNTPFPFLVLHVENKTCFPKRFGFGAMHWHNDLQFILVIDGNINIQTLNDEYNIDSKTGVFINKKVLHRITKNQNSEYISFIFPDNLLMSSNEILHQKFVSTYTENDNLDISLLLPSSESYKFLYALYKITKDKKNTPFYEIEAINSLHNLWNIFIQSIDYESKKTSFNNKKKQERIYATLNYIHNNYRENISIDDIAKSSHISKRELLRLFKSTLQTSPYKYLIDFRIKKSIELLNNSNLTISEIASFIGYNSQSQFGKHFKERMDLSPKQYRNSL